MYILPYLSKSFDVRSKQRILIEHYSFLERKFSLNQLRQLFSENGLEIYAESSEMDKYSIHLKSVTSHLEFEGSMSLLFKQNDITLYILCFTFVRGAIFELNDPHIVYVSALQGTKNAFEGIRISTKHFKDNSLPVILFKTLEAIAIQLGIKHCIGISAQNHLSLKDAGQYNRFFNNYDIFWQNNGATTICNDYLLSFPLTQKPIEQIVQTHRNRTLKKRQKMKEMAKMVSETMKSILQNREDL